MLVKDISSHQKNTLLPKLAAIALSLSVVGLTACGDTDSPSQGYSNDDDNSKPEVTAPTTEKDSGNNQKPTPAPVVKTTYDCEAPQASDADLATDGTFTINYLRHAGVYDDWCLHLWNDGFPRAIFTGWTSPRAFDEVVDGWNVARLPLQDASQEVSFIVHKGETKSPDNDLSVTPLLDGNEVWIVQDVNEVFFSKEEAINAIGEIGNTSAELDLSDVEIVDNDSGLAANWNQTATFIEVYVRGYADSDGDGVGDLQGLISKLDYIQDLGINGIWLMPVNESSDNDHGYAVTDYRAIEEDYGTMEDFEQLLEEAHARGIGIIMDYVINHSSSSNPLFKDSQVSKDNPKRDWYNWVDEAPTGWKIFNGNPWHTTDTGTYFGAFHSSMPDFNLDNPEVVNFHHNNLKFWLNKGVDGFRFDAVGVLFETSADEFENQPKNHPFMKDVRDLVDSYSNRYMVCEAPTGAKLFAQEDSCGRAFAFGAQNSFMHSGRLGQVIKGLIEWLEYPEFSNTPVVLSNHDSFVGKRPYDALKGDEQDLKLAAATYLLASPTPFIYYGEEVGLSGADIPHNDQALRAPMSWEGDNVTAGFTDGTPFRELAENVLTHNVEDAQANSDSLYWHYKKLIEIRNQYPVLMTGEIDVQSVGGDDALIYTRTDSANSVAVAINFTAEDVDVVIDTDNASSTYSEVFAGSSSAKTNSAGELEITIPAQGILVYAK